MTSATARRRRGRFLRLAAVTTLCALIPAVPAQAGRLIVTGYDPDHQCGRNQTRAPGQCNLARAGVDYVRAGAPNPSAPVLILARTDGRIDRLTGQPRNPDWVNALERAFGGASVPFRVVEPRSPEFANLPLSTNRYSAILVGASKDGTADDPYPQDLNEVGSTPDTDAINARAADIRAFFADGGGLFVGSGGSAARNDRRGYYAFLPVPASTFDVTPPFALTPLGAQIGLVDAPGTSDINGTFPKVSFEPPAPESPLKPAVLDGAGFPVMLVADQPRLPRTAEPLVSARTIGRDVPASTPGSGPGADTGTPGARSCRSSRRLRIVLRRPRGVRFSSVTVYRNGRQVKRVRRAQLGTRTRTRPITVTLLRGRTNKVTIRVRTTSNRQITIRRSYRVCR